MNVRQASSQPTTTGAFRSAIGKAITAAEARKASKDSCPSCHARLALLTFSFRGLKLGHLCRFCPHTSFVDFDKKQSKPKKRVTSRRMKKAR